MRPDVPHQFPLLWYLATSLLWEGTKSKKILYTCAFQSCIGLFTHVNLFTSQQYKVFGLKYVKYNTKKCLFCQFNGCSITVLVHYCSSYITVLNY